ncbi:sigma-70 family RNA polymerase sigma factor [candidate division KSB1 bacterium]|nr:sigma-70 family RNA polymerase sigma factor [candidate division KSB1 bacterium]
MNNNREADESELIRRSRMGDKDAFGQLVCIYMKRAYFSALGLVSSHEAALDLSQEAFVRAYRAIGKLDPERKFYTWLYQILRNLCFNYIRDRARHARPFSELDEQKMQQIADASQDASSRVETDELHQQLRRAINLLSPLEREVIVLKDLQELSYKEIAEVLGCPVGTVMSRLYNARKALRNSMKEYMNDRN